MSVELLAPCGSYESFLAAVNAGADAVYLAGNKYGARAYAENFDTEKLCFVIMHAHARKIRVYLTVNTLIKEEEFGELYDYIYPLAKVGLDGIIIQDLGVFRYLKQAFVDKEFPKLELHASTQMTITSAYGAAFMKKQGCKRIVPARELSLQEIQEIKKTVDIEVETFVHGAMCYCYSGQCLMSSFIGGRSGNRGRCAQPCRLPYKVNKKEGYYLSLKDMNTLECLPELIEAGIDSFKIEGRMKKPEYVAGVVSIYRKYIDLYQKNPEQYKIDRTDLMALSNLYIRSETSDGYYKKHNGKDMITFDKPGYNGTKERDLERLRARYVKEIPPIPVSVFVTAYEGQPLMAQMETEDGHMAIAYGATVEASEKKPATTADVEKQMKKLGSTPFVLKDFYANLQDNCFLPVKELNELRRNLVQALIENIYSSDDTPDLEEKTEVAEEFLEEKQEVTESVFEEKKEVTEPVLKEKPDAPILSVSVRTMSQLKAIWKLKGVWNGHIIIDSDLLYDNADEIEALVGEKGLAGQGVLLPSVLRKRDEAFLNRLEALLERFEIGIVYAGTLDGVEYLQQCKYPGKIAGDASLYSWNHQAYEFYNDYLDVLTLPSELNSKEIRQLCENVMSTNKLEAVVYGRAALMTTANCIKLTDGNCDHNREKNVVLTDRMGNDFPVYTNCNHCYNRIYNYLSTSLYDSMWMLKEDGIGRYRLDFTIEEGRAAAHILQTFAQVMASDNWKKTSADNMAVTRGHIKRGVE